MLDTHEFIKALKSAGFPEVQAEALAEQLKKSEQATLENLATKQDLQEAKRELKQDIQDVRRDMKELELRLKYDLTLRLGAMMAASIAIVAALVKLL